MGGEPRTGAALGCANPPEPAEYRSSAPLLEVDMQPGTTQRLPVGEAVHWSSAALQCKTRDRGAWTDFSVPSSQFGEHCVMMYSVRDACLPYACSFFGKTLIMEDDSLHLSDAEAPLNKLESISAISKRRRVEDGEHPQLFAFVPDRSSLRSVDLSGSNVTQDEVADLVLRSPFLEVSEELVALTRAPPLLRSLTARGRFDNLCTISTVPQLDWMSRHSSTATEVVLRGEESCSI